MSPCVLSFHLEERRSVSAAESSYAHFEGRNGDDPQSILRLLKTKNADRPVIGKLNSNSIAPKFEHLESHFQPSNLRWKVIQNLLDWIEMDMEVV